MSDEPFIYNPIPADVRTWPEDAVLVIAWDQMAQWHVRALVAGAEVDRAMEAVVESDSALDGAPIIGVKVGDSNKKIGKHRAAPPAPEPPPEIGLEDLPPVEPPESVVVEP